jgi:S1-C subfamily serine protease
VEVPVCFRLSPKRGQILAPRGLLIIGCILPLASACTRQYLVSDTGPQAYYQTGFPIRDTSAELERIAESILRIGVTASYTTYRFAREDSVTDASVRERSTLARARERYTFNHSKAGTASILAADERGLTLITNHHVTRTPDTIIVHFGESRAAAVAGRVVESISIRTLQRSYLYGLPDARPFRVIAHDSAADLALIRADVPRADQRAGMQVLRAPLGDASRLAWGSFVYVLGYPKGFRMVTRGIVSDPGYNAEDAFLLDGLFNRGISGGLILAVRSDTGALEWVGIATGTAAQTEYMLMPEARDNVEEGLLLPYEGRLYMELASRIEYGVTFPVATVAIRRFLQASRLSTARE